ncbi:uncharacterized protein LOC143263819 [Megalopta genalis]|uniref:uncharacterized protein LOC143263819 n=1 Tax=Megalopta genalis TaxID=115081 RepID=UPI003FD60B49
MPRNLSETDRKKNQFDKVERVHLLSLMKQYAPQLDKSTSTLARRKIWTTIENEFRKMVFTRKTSAQLKKYWQNYKYHCKKAKELAKDSEWNRHRVQVESRPASKFSESQHSSQPPSETKDWPSETQEDGRPSLDVIDLSCVKMEKEDADGGASSDHGGPECDELDEKKDVSSLDHSTDCKTRNRIVVSSANISDNSVTVSVLYPDANDRSAKDELHSCSTDVLWQSREQRRTCEDSSDSQNASKGQQTDCNEERDSSKHRIRPEELARRILPASLSAETAESTTAVVPTKRDVVERNEPLGSKIFVTNYPNQLKHRLLLQHLETEEKRLKVKIAEMGVQEVQLRIKAVHENMRRTEELHRLNLARAAAGNVNF